MESRLHFISINNNLLFIPQSSNSRGSFLSRDVSTLDKIAEMTKNTSSTKSGSSAKSSRNFAFAILSPPKQSDPADIVHELGKEKRKKSTKNLLLPQTKKAKIDRSINENSNDTIFTSIWYKSPILFLKHY